MSVLKKAWMVYAGRDLARKLEWVGEAVWQQPGREMLRGVYIDKTDGVQIVATDSQQMHIAEVSDADAKALPKCGLYRVRIVDPEIYLFCESDFTFPDWRRAVPKGGTQTVGIMAGDFTERALFRLMKTVDVPLQLRFVDSLVAFGGDWTLTHNGKDAPLVFSNTTGETAVMMPLKEIE